MRGIALSLFGVLALVAGFHVYWAVGGVWPGEDTQSLIYAVIGDPRFVRMPPAWTTLTIAGLLLAAGFVAVARARIVRLMPVRMALAASWVLALTFGFRAFSGFAAAIDLRTVEPPLTEPFATYDLLVYSPLCLLLGLGFLVLALGRPRR